MESKSLALAKSMLGKTVQVKIDRPLGTKHPKWDFEYPINYGFIEGIIAPDGEELDAYVLNVDRPVETFTGKVIAIIHRSENDDDKLVVANIQGQSLNVSDEEIEAAVAFQEKWFKHEIIR